ncbi:tRNA A64-2'-O-ribosylphosphate transferase [Kockovaella imperatae]|uniref:tRNA A64-2'-O-ribosylphosphate transferase n=1 Tax=Kockovaella imperatae TaxID=4999 RepID=A0A1Y1UC66_9TREE|nr:tRNA A64-2'-O-ribosylphosphate transferase [Kockovaella imperatae]ORX35640.1 tRNA A64-2'-O-ribosylphosphate transferase [Kockovaella imperatae]
MSETARAARCIRRHTAQHDLFNRIHSIASDQSFVKEVADHFQRFPVIPNQRCGNWYCDPSTSSDIYAYFKSTDGHTLKWDFNLRRSNLPFAGHIRNAGGIILVDSTRRGKRMPDALSKTVPAWCTVINRAIASKYGTPLEPSLFLPPAIVSASEKSQIEALIPTWVESLLSSSLTLPALDEPLRPFFIHPSTTTLPVIPRDAAYLPVICLSASRWVGSHSDDIPTFTRIGKETVGFEYVPGAGDDDELWARGLTPKLFHEHRNTLLKTPRDELCGVVEELVMGKLVASTVDINLCESSRSSMILGYPAPDSRLALDLGLPLCNSQWESPMTEAITIYVVQVDRLPKEIATVASLDSSGHNRLVILSNPRGDGKRYLESMSAALEAIQGLLEWQPVIIAPGHQTHIDVAVAFAGDQRHADSSQSTWTPVKDEWISSRKVILPLIVALACRLDQRKTDEVINKDTIASHVQRLVTLWPDSNPPRAALKRVNEVLMSDPR